MDTGEGHKDHSHKSGGDEGDSDASEAARDVAVFEFFAHACNDDDGKSPPESGADSIDGAFSEVEFSLDHEEGASENGAVDGDEGKEDTECVVESGYEAIEGHFEYLHDGGDDADEGDEGEEFEVEMFESGPSESAFLE